MVPITTPAAFPVAGLQITAANGAGDFVKPGGGSMPILGVAKVCLFGPCSAAVANLEVPLDVVGVGGTTYVTGPVNVTVVGAPWTTGTAVIGTSTVMGYSHGPASQTSSTAHASGVAAARHADLHLHQPRCGFRRDSGVRRVEPALRARADDARAARRRAAGHRRDRTPLAPTRLPLRSRVATSPDCTLRFGHSRGWPRRNGSPRMPRSSPRTWRTANLAAASPRFALDLLQSRRRPAASCCSSRSSRCGCRRARAARSTRSASSRSARTRTSSSS